MKTSQVQAALVPQPVITAERNSSVQLCESSGVALSLCVWEGKKGNCEREKIGIRAQPESRAGERTTAGISGHGKDFLEGKCGIEIQRTNGGDMGQWSCALLTTSGQTFVGEVNVKSKGTSARNFRLFQSLVFRWLIFSTYAPNFFGHCQC